MEFQTQLRSLAERFSGLDDARKVLFLEKLEAKSISFEQLPMVARKDDSGVWPLSAAQHALWLASQLNPQDTSYQLTFAIDIVGALDVNRLSAAIDCLFSRHSVLRVAFDITDAVDRDGVEQLVGQSITPFRPSALEKVVIAESALAQRLQEDATTPIDLQKGTPLLVKLYQLTEDHHVLSLVAHHLVFDNQSFLLLAQEMVLSYTTDDPLIEDAPSHRSADFIDYCTWQRDWSRSPAYDRQAAVWRQLLSDEEDRAALNGESLYRPLELLGDSSMLSVERPQRGGQRYRFSIDSALYQQVSEQCDALQVSPYTFLLSAYALALGQSVGRRSFTLGTSVANRSRQEMATALGMFVNTLLLPISRQDDVTIGEWLGAQQAKVIRALGASEVPLESLLRDQLAQNDSTFGQLCRTFFVFLDNSALLDTGLAARDATLTMIDPFDSPEHGPDLHFDLCLRVFRDVELGGCRCQLEFRPEVLDAATAQGLETLFRYWLGVLADPASANQALGRFIQVDRWGGPEPSLPLERPASRSVINRLMYIAQNHPDSVALSDHDGTLCYAELINEVQTVAGWYYSLGCRGGDRVVLHMSRHRMQVIHSLAVMATGASYLPMEPGLPHGLMVEQLTVCRPRFRIVDLDLDTADIQGVSTHRATDCQSAGAPVCLAELGESLSPDMPAYQIMTSGSSGLPKCVQVSHGALVAYVDGVMPVLELPADASMASLSSVAADLAYTAVYGALLSGRCLRLLDADIATDAAALAAALQQQPVDCLKLVPTHLSALLDVTEGRQVLPQICLVLGGEGLRPALLAKIRERSPTLKVINHYGPTEACIGVCAYQVPAQFDVKINEWATLPIGQPLPQAGLSVRNSMGEPLPPGLSGELWISGSSLAIGYLNNEEATIQAFPSKDGIRYYRSGDRVKRLIDGQFLFMERQDRQVKLRGFRIELADVEYRINQLEGVHGVFATLIDHGANPKLAVALCIRGATQDALPRLQAQAETVLPAPMRPSVWRCFEEFPLNRNGKLDRAALRSLLAAAGNETQPSDDQAILTPRDKIEQMLAQLWAETLTIPVEDISVNHSFIELGGDSILALQFIAAARQQQVILTPKQLFATGSIERLLEVAGFPGREIEQRIAEIWCDVLGLAPTEVRRHSDFVALGGDSILALQVIARLRKSAIKLTPKQFFSAPTIASAASIASIAAAQDDASHYGDSDDIAPFSLALVHESVIASWQDSADVETAFPATPTQQGMLFHSMAAPDRGLYINQFAVKLPVLSLDVERLSGAITMLAQRHDALRSRFYLPGLEGRDDSAYAPPHVVVEREASTRLIHLDWRGCSGLDSELDALMQQQLVEGIDVRQAPLMRLTLIDADEEQYLLWTFHHAVIDGWSIGHLVEELLSLLSPGTPALAMRPDGSRYAQWLASRDMQAAQAFWSNYLADFSSPNTLPLRSPAGAGARQEETGMGRCMTRFSASLTEASVQAARQAGVTHNTVIQGAWAMLLATLSRQQDTVFGVTLSGRPSDLEGSESMIGAFINTVPLRVDMSVVCSFATFLKDLQSNAMELQDYDYVPLLDIQRQAECSVSLFQSLIVYENHPVARNHAGTTQRHGDNPLANLEIVAADTGGTELPLTLWVYPGDELVIHWTYNRELVDPSQITLMAKLFERALEAIFDGVSQDRSVAEMTLLNAHDSKAYGVLNDQARVEFRGPHTLYDRFQSAAKTFKDRIAVSESGDGGPRVSYRELEVRVNQLANYLLKRGVGEGHRVAVHLERGVGMVIAVLAVQATGAAYVPLDTRFPVERLGMILDDAAPHCLIDSNLRALNAVLPADCGRVDLDCHETQRELLACDSSCPEAERSGGQVAYVIYTSGSTGRPKGVVIEQSSLVNLLLGMQQALALTPDDRLLAVTSLSFDIATVELYLPLLVGAEVVIASGTQVMDADYLGARLSPTHALPISVMQATPASWRLLLQSGWRRSKDLTVLSGGEPLSESLARELLSVDADEYESGRKAPLINCYGPTETTVWSSLHVVVADSLTAIGKPLANNVLQVLNPAGQLQPVGVPGELWIAGAGVARGYFQRDDLTLERFRNINGQRFYGTGDLALLDETGVYHCLGRLDQQVKIRGFRIEPGDIESAMLALNEVAQACVTIKHRGMDGSGWLDTPQDNADPHLVAYYVCDEASSEVIWSSIQSRLREVLPDYMVPSHGVILEALPLTPNGKADRKRLPLPKDDVDGADELSMVWLDETDDLGRQIYRAFVDTLGVETFAPDAQFFDLGGHSLLAMQAVARLQRLSREHGLQAIDIEMFFQSPSVSGVRETLLAIAPVAEGGVNTLLSAPVLTQRKTHNAVPMSFAQQRLWTLNELQGRSSAAYNMAAAARLGGVIDKDKLARAFDAVVQKQTALRTRLFAEDGVTQQAVNENSGFKLEMTPLPGLPLEDRENVIADYFRALRKKVFPLDAGCLIRAQALIFDEEVVVILSVHHVAFDAWSAGVLMNDLIASYMNQLAGKAAALAPLRIDYADYSAWQKNYLKGQYLEQRLQFWREALGGAPQSLTFPFTRPEAGATIADPLAGAELRRVLEVTDLQQLHNLAQSCGATLFMTLSAIYYLLLRSFTGSDDIVFGTDVANRPDPALEEVVGFFVNVIPLRFREPGNLSFRDLMLAVRTRLLDYYRYQDVPFELLVDELGMRSAGDDMPLVQSLLVLQNTPFSAPHAVGDSLDDDVPQVSLMDIDNEVSRFDLSLFVAEVKGGLALSWKYRLSRFAAADIASVAAAFETLLGRVVAEPDLSIRELCNSVVNADSNADERQDKRAKRRIGRSPRRSLADNVTDSASGG